MKLQRLSLKDQAADILRERIISGQIPAGSKLVEREVADLLGISRAPARDALMQLEKEGLVVSKLDARYVIELTERDIRELHAVRLVLERLAVDLATQHTSAHNRSAQVETLHMMEDAIARRDRTAFALADVEGHTLIWEQADNLHLKNTLHSMIGPIFMFMANSAELYDWEETYDLHRNLVECINSGDRSAALASIERHMENSCERSVGVFRVRHEETENNHRVEQMNSP
ncbi:MAG: GntR family transcriptional regulator [Anaerolineae bacterium]|nr:GntR family transcriptional regulator [Anaerolineae bacterium]